ncbi:MAG: BTAD domain-containing putative transcriptional regulator [Methylococcaceae bacterium]
MKANLSIPQIPAKLTRPKAHGAFHRTRLFERLDAARESPIVWITSPAGAGKTVLLSSYIQARNLACLWYQVDEGDADIANFFHYLGLAAQQFASSSFQSLLALTPEYMPGLGVFSRRFFEMLYQRLSPPVLLVLDNYQEAPETAPLHEILRDGAALSPPGTNLIIICRTDPPPCYARLRIHGELTVIGFNEVKLTLDEAQGIAFLRRAGRESSMEPGWVELCHAQSQGWMAGLVLLLEQAKSESGKPLRMPESTQGLLFEYFAGEIFESLPAVTKAILLETSVLPKITSDLADELTGNTEAGQVLMELYKKDFFILRREEAEIAFEYHPLFREFLQAQSKQTLSAQAFRDLLSKAAGALINAGQQEEAILLYLEAEEWEQVSPVIQTRALALLSQGRHQTLGQWLAAIPKDVLSGNGWLLYWLGNARLPYDLPVARRYFENSFSVFDLGDDATGLYLSWVAIVNSYFLEWGDFSELDRWIDTYAYLRRRYPAWPSAEVEAQAYSTVISFVYRQPQLPELPTWAERAITLLDSGAVGGQSILLAANLLHYYVWMGNLNVAAQIADRLSALTADPHTQPFAFILSKGMLALFHWSKGEAAVGLEQVREGLAQAEASGIHIWDIHLNAQGVYCGLNSGNPNLAEEFLCKIRPLLRLNRYLDVAHYHYMKGLLALQREDTFQSIEHLRASLPLSIRAGSSHAQATAHTCLALLLFQCDRDEEAAEHLQNGRRLMMDTGSVLMNCIDLLTEARVHLERGEKTQGLAVLERALAMSRESGGLTLVGWWGPKVMAWLYAAALEANIEVSYVQGLIRRMDLAPPDPGSAPDNWPWPVKLYTFGSFSIVNNGEPLHFNGKAQQKPLELLMALIALGEQDVSQERLADLLWPDAEGDAAYRALITTVHRLRKLLVCPSAILFNEGRLSIDRRYVWVDACAFERLLDNAASDSDIATVRERVALLYRGPFLKQAETPWAIVRRERLAARYLHYILNTGQALEAAGLWRDATGLYQQSIEADVTVEAFHQRLIRCHIEQGQIAEARAAYDYCRSVLAVQPGREPSAATEKLILSLGRLG